MPAAVPAFEPRRESAVHQLVRQLRGHIAERGLNTGDSLPTERELSETFGVARNTVREAIGVLRAYGVIDVRPKVGAVLINRHLEAALDVFSFQLTVDPQTFRDIQGFRRLIEVGACDELIARVTEADLAGLERINARMVEAGPVEAVAREDFAFHLALMTIAGNKTVRDVYRIMEPVIARLMEVGKAERGRLAAHDSHAAIIAALRARDRLAYQYRMTEHLAQGLAFIEGATTGSAATGFAS
jgi:DNA-binding FadR family transcriptional regulator